ncbi:NAD(P)-binding domain-containing protein [Streptomyces halobius]|uniref:Uncharacterized protein n=1 Tax=Streptomyces halobius TaxID=2879846 RepID=A0ABY4MKQ3_9ACTN|nr:hypothetical protein [Streptomyces halobius]UQA97289.1 hypothetical protein K9S39_40370 [Streptomyces halobius]
MTDPAALADGDHTLFLSGNDGHAKQQVTELLAAYGWSDIIDLGEITTVRATEMIQPLHLSLVGTLGNEHFNFKIVR